MPFAVVLLALAAPPEGWTAPPVKRGAMEARLTVHVVEPVQTPGFAVMLWTLEIEGPPLLEVEKPKLGEVNERWEDERTTWASLKNGRITWVQELRLSQSQEGTATLPTLSVRFRESADAAWQSARWTNILSEPSEGPSLEPAPPAPSTPVPLWWFFVAGAVALGLLIAAILLLRPRRKPPEPPTPEQVALAELDRAEERHRADASEFLTQLSSLLRRYLSERYPLRALQQTTAEFLAAVRTVPELTDEQKALLVEVLERCDLGRFARAAVSPEECRRLAEQVRGFISAGVSRESPT